MIQNAPCTSPNKSNQSKKTSHAYRLLEKYLYISVVEKLAKIEGFDGGACRVNGCANRLYGRALTYIYVNTRVFKQTESNLFFYHSDHLGSSSFITDATGNATQHLQYLSFGEAWIDQQSGSFDSRYKFSAKELDDETGYNYFGARYLDTDLSVWLSVDPKSDKHSNFTPYAYCFNNPINLVDPIGMDTLLVNNKSGDILDVHTGGEDVVFMTKKREASAKAWRKSDQLYYELDISGENGGTPSSKGEPVIWSELMDHTNNFNNVLLNITTQFDCQRLKMDDAEFTVPGNKYIEKLRYQNFYFETNAPYDIKQDAFHPKSKGEWSWYNGKLTRYDDYGNMLYGCAGTALGLGKSTLTGAAAIAQFISTFTREPSRDKQQIKRGISLYYSRKNK